MDIDVNKIQYPCPQNNKLTNIQDCATCDKCLGCDIYSTMLDEVHDMK